MKNYLLKLYNGDEHLYVTFWGWWLIGYGIIFGLLNVISSFLNSFASLYFISITFLGIIQIVFYIFLSIAVWRSANKYNGKKLYVYLAKIAIVLSVCYNIYNIAMIKEQTPNYEASLQGELLRINNDLPKEIDSMTVLEKLEYKNGSVIYNYLLKLSVHPSPEKINLILKDIKEKDLESICNNDIFQFIINNNKKSVVYRYYDTNKKDIGQFSIIVKDCQTFGKKK